jgi:MFS family permease
MSSNGSPAAGRADAYAVLRVPAFRFFLAARLLMTLANQIMSVSVGYFVYDLTGNPLMLGFIGLAEAVPAISISLYAGHLADKYNRRNILLGCIALLLLCSVALCWLTTQRGHWPNEWVLAGMYGVLFCTGIGRGFFSPTNFALLPQLVDKKSLSNAIAWNSSIWEIGSISGLGLGGLLYGFLGVGPTFLIMTSLCALGFVAMLCIASRPLPPIDRTESAASRIRAGLRFVFSNQLIIGTIALDLFAVLFGGAVALLPVFAKDILQVGPQGLGILRAATALGAIVMALVMAHRPLGRGSGKLLLGCVAGFGLCIIGFGLSRNFWLSFFFLFLSGALDGVSVFIRASLVQLLTPDHMKGRVSSVNSIFITSSNELGAFESGLAAHWLGTVPAVVFGGIMTLVVVGAAWRYAPQLATLDLDDFKQKETSP